MNETILIIEDEKDVREAEAEALESAGFTVLTADNGEVGLQMALEHKPDLIILDILMPVMGGQEMLTRLRLDEWGANAKVVVATSLDDAKNTGSAFANGVSDYIVKSSMSLADIVRIAKDVCSRAQ